MTITAAGGWVCFNHGKESGPWGTKITRLAEVARQQGFAVHSPDYSHSPDPAARVRQLLALQLPRSGPRVLVGSSMGGYVAAQACAALKPDALFLMAPALYFPGWDEEPEGIPQDTVVVHGWDDDIVPAERALRFASRHHAALHLYRAGHGLSEVLEEIAVLFERQLRRLREAVP
jgi:pimeloyl-ACP methyl ester carboxylesterase